MNIFLKIVSIIIITIIGGAITCGGNIVLANFNILDSLDNFLGFGNSYFGEPIYWYLWALELLAIFIGANYYMWKRSDTLSPRFHSIWNTIIIALIAILCMGLMVFLFGL